MILQGLCPSPGTCKNTDGSFKCVCPRGYQLDNTGTFCVDFNACTADSRCEEGCRNTAAGGYECGCPPGFQLHLYYNQCVDRNECAEAVNPCGSSRCTNTIGSYECGCPAGYQFDTALSVCVQAGGGGCGSAPCAFGCSPSGPQGYSCECPRGYQSIGDGHCVATVNPSSYQALARDWDLEDGEEGTDDFISTEGCFSCQINGGSRGGGRKGRKKQRSRRNANLSDKDKFFRLLSNQTTEVEPHNYKINLNVTMEQTANRKRIVKLQPSRSDLIKSLDYRLIGDSSGQLILKRISGIWGLFFKKRVSDPQNFVAYIKGDPLRGPNFSEKYINTVVNITVA